MLAPRQFTQMFNLIDKVEKEHNLKDIELLELLKCKDKKVLEYLYQKADKVRQKVYGKDVFIRGLIEISNFCKNNCLYCGIRAENKSCERYRLTKEEILSCVKENYPKGFRTFVLQGGEDLYFSDEILCEIIKEIKQIYPDVCVTLSLGERTKESYQKLYDAGAERYLLRHETANKEHYEKLHPQKMSFDNRVECLKNLKEIGYQTGCGFMVGSPYQTLENLVEDLKFIKDFKPEMCGIGPFIPHKDTPFKDFKQGDLGLTLKILAIVRLLVPNVLLPATTALATISENGRELGLKAGANVIMPNLLPIETTKKYSLYNNKFHEESDTKKLKLELEKIGYNLVISRGDNRINVNKKQNLSPLLGGGQGGGAL